MPCVWTLLKKCRGPRVQLTSCFGHKVCTGIDLYTDFVGVKDECLPWTRCALQRRWNKSQSEAYVFPGQESCWEANETPAKRIYRLHLLGAKDREDSWRKVYHQCHCGAFKHSQ